MAGKAYYDAYANAITAKINDVAGSALDATLGDVAAASNKALENETKEDHAVRIMTAQAGFAKDAQVAANDLLYA